MRKKNNFTKSERINLFISCSDTCDFLSQHADYIKFKVGASSLEFKDEVCEFVEEFKIKNLIFKICFNKI